MSQLDYEDLQVQDRIGTENIVRVIRYFAMLKLKPVYILVWRKLLKCRDEKIELLFEPF